MDCKFISGQTLKYFLPFLLLLGILVPVFSLAATVDWTTYTESNDSNVLTVAAEQIDFTALTKNSSSTVYADQGVGYFGSTFTHSISFQVTELVASSDSYVGIQALANDVLPGSGDDPTLIIYVNYDGSFSSDFRRRLFLMIDDGAVDETASSTISLNTTYYLLLDKNNTDTDLYIYSDSARTILLDTLTVSNGSTSYRYNHHGTSKNYTGGTGGSITGSIYSLDLDATSPATPVSSASTPTSQDYNPPVRYSGQPAEILTEGITQTTISLKTDEPAVCKYSTERFTPEYLMTKVFSPGNNISHSASITGLDSGKTYNYYVRCKDASGNANPDDFLISFSTAADTTPPVRSVGSPEGALATGIVRADLSLATNESATCRYSTVAGIAYDSMVNIFLTVDGTLHSSLLEGLTAEKNYKYYVRCQDANGNKNMDDYVISFNTVSSPTLAVTLNANVISGQAPLYGVDLTANVSGTETGTIHYTFYCDRVDAGTDIIPKYDAKYNSIVAVSQTADDACNYLSPGTYHPKVIVERGGQSAEARIEITVMEESWEEIGNEAILEKIRVKIIEIQQKIIELIEQFTRTLGSQVIMLKNFLASLFSGFYNR